MWGLEAERLTEQLNRDVRRVAAHGATWVCHYWGIDDHHHDNLVHRHSFFEQCYIVQGEGTYREASATIQLVPGTMFLSKPGVLHQIQSRNGLAIAFVAFDLERAHSTPEWIEQSDHLAIVDDKPAAVSAADTPVLAAAWESLCLAVAHQAHDATVLALASALLTAIPRAFGIVGEQGRRLAASSPLADRARKFITDNVGHPLRLAQVADYLGVSDRQLSKVMRQSCGMGFRAWLIHQRVARAKALLIQTELPIKQIAEQMGFYSVHHFTHVFKEHCQTTPAQYRRHHWTAAVR